MKAADRLKNRLSPKSIELEIQKDTPVHLRVRYFDNRPFIDAEDVEKIIEEKTKHRCNTLVKEINDKYDLARATGNNIQPIQSP